MSEKTDIPQIPYPAIVRDEHRAYVDQCFAELYDRGQVSAIDILQFSAMAVSLTTWANAIEQMGEDYVVPSPRGGLQRNPLDVVETDSWAKAFELMKQYGMTLRARKTAQMDVNEKPQNDIDKFLDGIG